MSARLEPIVHRRSISMKHFPITQGIVFQRPVGAVRAVDGISFTSRAAKRWGWWARAGCGKTTAGRTLLGLYPPTGGKVIIDGLDVRAAKGDELLAIRRKAQMIFQDPLCLAQPALDGRMPSWASRCGCTNCARPISSAPSGSWNCWSWSA